MEHTSAQLTWLRRCCSPLLQQTEPLGSDHQGRSPPAAAQAGISATPVPRNADPLQGGPMQARGFAQVKHVPIMCHAAAYSTAALGCSGVLSAAGKPWCSGGGSLNTACNILRWPWGRNTGQPVSTWGALNQLKKESPGSSGLAGRRAELGVGVVGSLPGRQAMALPAPRRVGPWYGTRIMHANVARVAIWSEPPASQVHGVQCQAPLLAP